MKKTLLCFSLLALLSACSDYTAWDNRGPDASGVQTQKSLALPPDFFLRAPEPGMAATPAQQIDQEEAIPTDVPAEAPNDEPEIEAPEVTF